MIFIGDSTLETYRPASPIGEWLVIEQEEAPDPQHSVINIGTRLSIIQCKRLRGQRLLGALVTESDATISWHMLFDKLFFRHITTSMWLKLAGRYITVALARRSWARFSVCLLMTLECRRVFYQASQVCQMFPSIRKFKQDYSYIPLPSVLKCFRA